MLLPDLLKSKLLGLALFIIAAYVSNASGEIQEQTPSGGYTPSDNGRGGNCEELAKNGPLEQYLQPDDIDSGKYDDYSANKAHICTRQCSPNEPPKICYYKFQVERYVTMGLACKDCPNNKRDCVRDQCVTADGYERMIITVNRRMPGPSIQVCQNDLIVVDVKNRMPGTGVTVHWHGITQQGTPYMDGVPMVTQCPIMEAQVFRYYFQPTNPGLFFWHSHEGLQKVDGFLGSLVVRRPVRQDPNGNRYDYDLPSHVIVIQDWLHEVADALFPGLRKRRVGTHPDTYLINGKGVYTDRNGNKLLNTPLATFNVNTGAAYVFRIIGGTCLSCPFRFQIEDHTLTIIGMDGRDTEARTVDSVVISAGERYSLVVRRKREAAVKQNYWIHVTGTGICNEEEKIPSQVALLRYKSNGGNNNNSNNERLQAPNSPPPSGVIMSDANARCDGGDGICYIHLSGTDEAPIAIRQSKPDYRMVWGIDFYTFHNNIDEAFPENHYITTFVPTGDAPYASLINGIANAMSPVPVLTQYNDLPQCLLCSSNNPFRRWRDNFHECLHVFRVLRYPSVVEIVIVDIGAENTRTGMAHPMHLHGYDQYLIEQGILGARKESELENLIRRLDNNNNIPRKPIMKDTFLLASGGYLVLRIIADNPGFWLFHCHFAYHSETGMAAILQIGEPQDHPKPPRGFPTCNNFLPQPKFTNNTRR